MVIGVALMRMVNLIRKVNCDSNNFFIYFLQKCAISILQCSDPVQVVGQVSPITTICSAKMSHSWREIYCRKVVFWCLSFSDLKIAFNSKPVSEDIYEIQFNPQYKCDIYCIR